MGTCNKNGFHSTKARNFNQPKIGDFNQEEPDISTVTKIGDSTCQDFHIPPFPSQHGSWSLPGEPAKFGGWTGWTPHCFLHTDLWASGPGVRQLHHSNVRPQLSQRHLDHRRWSHFMPFPFTGNAKFDYPWLLGCPSIDGQSWPPQGSKPN